MWVGPYPGPVTLDIITPCPMIITHCKHSQTFLLDHRWHHSVHLCSHLSVGAYRSWTRVKRWPNHQASMRIKKASETPLTRHNSSFVITSHMTHVPLASYGRGRVVGRVRYSEFLGEVSDVLVIVATCGRGYKQSTCDWRSSSHHHAAYFCVPWLKICQPTGPLDKVSCRMILYFPISDTIYEAILLQPSYSPTHS